MSKSGNIHFIADDDEQAILIAQKLLDLAVQRAQEPFMAAALQDTDRRVAEGKPVAPSFLLACLLWQDVRALWQQRTAQGEHTHPALQAAIDEVFDARIGDVSGRGRLAADMREIWMMQPRFEKRTGASCHTLAEQPRFRAGLDFLQRCGCGLERSMLKYKKLLLSAKIGRASCRERV